MRDVRYEHIRHLIARERVEGSRVVVVFRCPQAAEGSSVSSMAPIRAASDAPARRYVETQARSMQWNMRQDLARSMSAMLGSGIAGSIAHQTVMRATESAAKMTGRQEIYTEDDKRAAVVQAFLAVQQHFEVDPAGRWVARGTTQRHAGARGSARHAPHDATSPTSGPSGQQAWSRMPDIPSLSPSFRGRSGHSVPTTPAYNPAQQATAAPATFLDVIRRSTLDNAEDRRILVRMISEMAWADGSIADEEALMLKSIGASPQDLDPSSPPLSTEELQKTTAAGREGLMTMAMAIAYSDEHIDPSEVSRLEHFRQGLGISRMRQSQLDRMAREHLVTLLVQRAYRDGTPDPEATRRLKSQAIRLGVAQAKVNAIIQGVTTDR